jgi:hypothetical protein
MRYDMIKCRCDLFDAVYDDDIRRLAQQLIASEQDLKYRKKYAMLWR